MKNIGIGPENPNCSSFNYNSHPVYWKGNFSVPQQA